MILINISSDSVGLFRNGQSTFVPKREMIDDFHQILFDIIQNNKINKCFVISGPGSFTTLRTAALVINTFISTKTRTPFLFQLDKISFFDVFIQNYLLPSTGIINIGQKNNMREINYELQITSYDTAGSSFGGDRKNNYTKQPISKKNISDKFGKVTSDSSLGKDFFVEGLYEETFDEKTSKKTFFITSIDNCDFENKEGTLNYSYNGQISQISFFDFKRKKVKFITPEYMMDAVK